MKLSCIHTELSILLWRNLVYFYGSIDSLKDPVATKYFSDLIQIKFVYLLSINSVVGYQPRSRSRIH